MESHYSECKDELSNSLGSATAWASPSFSVIHSSSSWFTVSLMNQAVIITHTRLSSWCLLTCHIMSGAYVRASLQETRLPVRAVLSSVLLSWGSMLHSNLLTSSLLSHSLWYYWWPWKRRQTYNSFFFSFISLSSMVLQAHVYVCTINK